LNVDFIDTEILQWIAIQTNWVCTHLERQWVGCRKANYYHMKLVMRTNGKRRSHVKKISPNKSLSRVKHLLKMGECQPIY